MKKTEKPGCSIAIGRRWLLSAYDERAMFGFNATKPDEGCASKVYDWAYKLGTSVTFDCPNAMACDNGALLGDVFT